MMTAIPFGFSVPPLDVKAVAKRFDDWKVLLNVSFSDAPSGE